MGSGKRGSDLSLACLAMRQQFLLEMCKLNNMRRVIRMRSLIVNVGQVVNGS